MGQKQPCTYHMCSKFQHFTRINKNDNRRVRIRIYIHIYLFFTVLTENMYLRASVELTVSELITDCVCIHILNPILLDKPTMHSFT